MHARARLGRPSAAADLRLRVLLHGGLAEEVSAPLGVGLHAVLAALVHDPQPKLRLRVALPPSLRACGRCASALERAESLDRVSAQHGAGAASSAPPPLPY